jgi:hypothetical protein
MRKRKRGERNKRRRVNMFRKSEEITEENRCSGKDEKERMKIERGGKVH